MGFQAVPPVLLQPSGLGDHSGDPLTPVYRPPSLTPISLVGQLYKIYHLCHHPLGVVARTRFKFQARFLHRLPNTDCPPPSSVLPAAFWNDAGNPASRFPGCRLEFVLSELC
jgi:hypothetical protein